MTQPSPLRKKITLAVVAGIPTDTMIWDTDLKGFAIRRQKSPAVTYLFKTRVRGAIRWLTIGRHGQATPDGDVWRPETARRRALLLAGNPALADEPASSGALTLTDVAARFLADHGHNLSAKSLVDYRGNLKNHILPVLGRDSVTDLTYARVSEAYARWAKQPRVANYCLAILSKIMTWCEDHAIRPRNTNPCRGIKRKKETKRQTFLQGDELARLGAALDEAEAQNLVSLYAAAALRLLLFTGARMNEILTLQWSFIDLERSLIFLPQSKTGQKTITLNAAAIAVLKALPRFANNPFVIVGRRGEHMVNLFKPWDIIRKRAGLPELRIHDLRHTFSSVAVAAGGSLPVLGRQLGHSNPQTTQRYAHLADDPVRQLTEATGQRLAKALCGKSE